MWLDDLTPAAKIRLTAEINTYIQTLPEPQQIEAETGPMPIHVVDDHPPIIIVNLQRFPDVPPMPSLELNAHDFGVHVVDGRVVVIDEGGAQ